MGLANGMVHQHPWQTSLAFHLLEGPLRLRGAAGPPRSAPFLRAGGRRTPTPWGPRRPPRGPWPGARPAPAEAAERPPWSSWFRRPSPASESPGRSPAFREGRSYFGLPRTYSRRFRVQQLPDRSPERSLGVVRAEVREVHHHDPPARGGSSSTISSRGARRVAAAPVCASKIGATASTPTAEPEKRAKKSILVPASLSGSTSTFAPRT